MAVCAPVFICRARPGSLWTICDVKFRAIFRVSSWLPPSAMMISCGFRAEASDKEFTMPWASSSVGMMIEIFNEVYDV